MREEDKIEEVLLFYEPDKSKIKDRKRYVEDLVNEREVKTDAGRGVTKRHAMEECTVYT